MKALCDECLQVTSCPCCETYRDGLELAATAVVTVTAITAAIATSYHGYHSCHGVAAAVAVTAMVADMATTLYYFRILIEAP